MYRAAAEFMTRDNVSIPRQQLDSRQKQVLRTEFGSLVDRVTVRYGADMMDRWGVGDFEISAGSDGQTFCNEIYIEDSYRKDSDSQLILLAHELQHSRQCENFGGISNFGYRYFKEFKKAGQNYENNALEKDAREVASRVAQADFPPPIVGGNGISNPTYIVETPRQPAVAVFESLRESFALGCPEIRDSWGVTDRRGVSSDEFQSVLRSNPVVADLSCDGGTQWMKLSDEPPHLLWIRHRDGQMCRHYINSTNFPSALRSGSMQRNDGPTFRAAYPCRGNDFQVVD